MNEDQKKNNRRGTKLYECLATHKNTRTHTLGVLVVIKLMGRYVYYIRFKIIRKFQSDGIFFVFASQLFGVVVAAAATTAAIVRFNVWQAC